MSEVEIFTGFSGSGKTRFLNTYIEFTNVKKERILIIIVGDGNTKLHNKMRNPYLRIKVFSSVLDINESKLLYMLNIYNPHRLLIEGDYFSINNILKIVSSHTLKRILVITSKINIINSRFIKKISKLNANKIQSNVILINNYDKLSFEDECITDIRIKNVNSFLFCVECFSEVYFKFKDHGLLKGDIHKNLFKYIKECI